MVGIKRLKDTKGVIRINRLVQNISSKFFSELLGTDTSQLSKIERGIVNLNQNVVDTLSNELDIDFNNYDHFTQESNELFHKIYNDIVFKRDAHNIERKIELYKKLCEKYFYTCEFVLLNFIYQLAYNQNVKEAESYRNILNEVESLLSPELRCLYNQYQGYYFFIIGELFEAKKYIYLAEEEFYINEHYRALLMFIHGQINGRSGNYFEAYDQLNSAMKVFQLYNNYRRVIYCIISIANVYLLSDFYDKAIESYNDALVLYDDFKLDKENRERSVIYNNILSTYIFKNDPEGFFKFNKQVPSDIKEKLQSNGRYNFYCVYAFYEIGKIEECKKYIKRYYEIKQNDDDLLAFKYYEFKLQGRNEEGVECLEEYYDRLSMAGNNNFSRVIVRLLMKEYKGRGDGKLENIIDDILSNSMI